MAFIRSLDLEGYIQTASPNGQGAQTSRLRFRYLDPDVNAFVGLVTGVSHFNQDLRLRDPQDPTTAGILWNGGIDLGLRRGKHLWELDLMGAVLSNSVAPALAIVGEHSLGKRWIVYHRTEGNFFSGDTVADADQGVIWMGNEWIGISAGFRFFASRHMSRNGPHIGFSLRFQSPKIPFLFPSLG